MSKPKPLLTTSLPPTTNALHAGLDFLRTFIGWRLYSHAGTVEPRPTLPNLSGDTSSPLVPFIIDSQLDEAELIVLLLALAPHLHPGFLDEIIREALPGGGELPEFGGVRGQQHRGLLPTGETALFVLAGSDIAQRMALLDLFGPDHFFAREHILTLEAVPIGEPRLSGRLILDAEWVELFTTGRVAPPTLSMAFPAQHLTTALSWSDLILPESTMAQIQDIEYWCAHAGKLRADGQLGQRMKPGFRALFYGPPGTGKTLTAALLGKFTGREVFRIDLSMVVSKFIGETEKNLGSLFDKANAKHWILFFDEADALFGKRSETRDAHDRYANQEVAFLLQKIEEFDGLVILASNLKSNLDPAFSRRFQAMIHFPIPTATERKRLWLQTIPNDLPLAPDVSIDQLANHYELTGAAILNVVQFAALRALAHADPSVGNGPMLAAADLLEGIRLDYQKEGKLV